MSKNLKESQGSNFSEKGFQDASKCETLVDTLKVVSRLHERKVDFFKRVPYDVLCKIAGNMNTKALDECVNVSLTWRNIIINCPAFWRHVVIQEDKMTSVLYLLPKVAQYIRDFKICMEQDYVRKVLRVMQMGYFSNLQSLSFAMCYEKSNESFYKTYPNRVKRVKANPPIAEYITLWEVLPYVANTLTSLKLWFPVYLNKDAPPLRKILEICRNLVELDYSVMSTSAFANLHMPYKMLLTRVSLTASFWQVISQESLRGLLQCSPYIRWLSVGCCPYDALSIIAQFPLQLEYLSIDCTDKNVHLPPKHYLEGSAENKYQGFRCLVLMGIEIPSEALLLFLEKHRHTIQGLYLSGINRYLQLGHDDIEDNNNGDDASFKFPNMTMLDTLYIKSDSQANDYWKATSRIIRGCPKLNALIIQHNQLCESVDIPDRLVDAVTGMKSLSTLKLLYTSLDSSSISRLLTNYATKDFNKAPSDLELINCRYREKGRSGLMSIPFLKSLKALRLHGVYATDSKTKSIYKLCQALADMPQLEYLHIDGHQSNDIDDNGLRILSQIKSLKIVQLEYTSKVDFTEKGVAMLRERAPPIHLYLHYRQTEAFHTV